MTGARQGARKAPSIRQVTCAKSWESAQSKEYTGERNLCRDGTMHGDKKARKKQGKTERQGTCRADRRGKEATACPLESMTVCRPVVLLAQPVPCLVPYSPLPCLASSLLHPCLASSLLLSCSWPPLARLHSPCSLLALHQPQLLPPNPRLPPPPHQRYRPPLRCRLPRLQGRHRPLPGRCSLLPCD